MNSQGECIGLRKNFQLLLLENPNYFGNLTEVGEMIEDLEPQVQIISDTSYEELTCVSFNPEKDELKGVVQIKQSSGYSGGPCTDGSKEYVRFYVDYNRDGTWIDEGVVNFDVHDLPFQEHLCYAVNLKIDPKTRRCCDRKPVLPRVLAILSWNQEPPANMPNWLPVWGNRLEVNIQLAPRSPFWCLIFDKKFEELGIQVDPDTLAVLGDSLEIQEQPIPSLQADLLLLKQQYSEQVEEARFGYPSILALSKNPAQLQWVNQAKAFKDAGINIIKVLDFIQNPNFNTSYEEVKCVGLDRDLSILHGSIQIKRPFGYSGGLCYQGSLEYLAFYMDFGSGWQYMGTTSVKVHDIPEIPEDGLWYHAALPVSLTKYQQVWCQTGKAKVRAILSWNVEPTPGNPNYVAPWGDREECTVEIKPLPKGVIPGELVAVIESLGGMPINLINSSGYANGQNATGLTAVDSPFDGNILITGIIAPTPDSSESGVAKLRYRLMVKQPAQSAFQPWLGQFSIYVTTINGGIPSPQVQVTQIPDSQGWIDYYPDFVSPNIVSVDRNLLGVFVPATEGLHEIYVEIFDPNTSISAQSSPVNFMVDKTRVEVDIEITSGTGNCGVFQRGDVISGTFSISDAHCYTMTLLVTPSDETNGATPVTTSPPVGYSQLVYGSPIAPLPGTGISGTWQLETEPMEPCGYNIRIRGVERTIINSSTISRDDEDIEGFCLD